MQGTKQIIRDAKTELTSTLGTVAKAVHLVDALEQNGYAHSTLAGVLRKESAFALEVMRKRHKQLHIDLVKAQIRSDLIALRAEIAKLSRTR
jgi:hypothetical protein